MTSKRIGIERRGAGRFAADAGERAVSLVFFLSGTAGLIFEIVWFERCGLVFGNSVWATSIVLSSFMAGLALGNALSGRFANRISQPLRLYATLEAIVAVSGIAVTYGLIALIGVIAVLTRPFGTSSWMVNSVRLAAASAVLVVPTTAMGATLPALVGAVCRGRSGFGRVLGRLYGWNTLGAVVGVIGTEVVLVRRVGITGSAWIAMLLNLAAAACAWWMARGEGRRDAGVATPQPITSRLASGRLLAGAFFAGGNLLALEVLWVRFLSMFIVASTLAISLTLAVVLTAIGFGGLAASAWLDRQPRAVSYLPALAFVAACVTATSYVAFRYVTGGPLAAEWYRVLWFACVMTFPTSLVSGVIFTFIGAAVKRDVVGDERAAAWTLLANVMGGMVGPLVAAFVLLPMLGMERSVFALALIYAGIGILALWDTVRGWSRAAAGASAAAAACAIVVFATFPAGSMSNYFTRAVQGFAADGSRLVATREGSAETILLMEKTWIGKPLFYRLVTNSFSMSGTQLTGKRYMRYFAYWPMFLHGGPLKRVLVICYGVGVTLGAVTDNRSVDSIDVVETSRDIVAMSDIIYPPDQRPLRDPRVRLHIEDGRNFLQMSTDRFDLITGEPPPPLTPGTVNLYTREYFRLVHDRLADEGMVTYWLPVARRGEYDVKGIIRAFCDVFDDCSLWNGTPLDWVLIGTRRATGPVPEAHFTVRDDPVLSSHLQEIGFEVPEQLGATFLGDAGYLRGLGEGALPLTDDYPQRLRPRPARLSLASPLDRTADGSEVEFIGRVIDPFRARAAFERSEFVQRLWPKTLVMRTLPFFEHQRTVNRIMFEGANPLRYIEELHGLLTKTSLQKLPQWELGSDDVQQQIAGAADDGSFMVSYLRGVRALAARNYAEAATSFADAERRGLRAASARPLLVYALCLAGEIEAARQLAQGDMPRDPDRQHFWRWLGAEFGVGPGTKYQPITQ